MNKLLPCPFCGEKAKLANRNWFVECNNCATEGPWNGDYDTSKATSDWNTRAAPTVAAGLPEPVAWRYIERTEEGFSYAPGFSQARWENIPHGYYDEAALVLRDTVAPVFAERDALKAEVQRLQEREIIGSFEKCMEAMADRDAHAKRTAELEALLAKGKEVLPERMPHPTLKGGTDPVSIAYDVASGFNACLDACAPIVADMAARNAELEAENERLIQDRARFPDRPDDIGKMIGSHMESMKRRAESAEGSLRWRHHEIDTLRAKTDKLVELLGDLKGKTILSWADKHRIDAALADEAPSPNTRA